MTLEEVKFSVSGRMGGRLHAGGRVFEISHGCVPGTSEECWLVSYPDGRKDAMFMSAEDAVRSCVPDGSDMDSFLADADVLVYPG